MPSPVNDNGDAPLIDDTPQVSRLPRRRWWVLLGVLIGVPLLLTLAGVVTAPPRAAHVPTGRIVFLEADQPSEHTSLLRGLRVTLPGSGESREVLHETEPQDVDAGSRDWLTQPIVSPDGRWLAYEKQLITLQEEKTGIVNQLWAVRLDTPHAAPHLLLNLTAQHFKQPIGLAWTPDSRQVAFLSDTHLCRVNAEGAPLVNIAPVPDLPPLSLSPSLSATRNLASLGAGAWALAARTGTGTQILLTQGGNLTRLDYPHPPSPVWAAAPGGALATAVPLGRLPISIRPAEGTAQAPAQPQTIPQIIPRWGWSVFGGRHITSLKWSPDGRYLGYTVSKPPFEDELFYADTVTGKCWQLPIRTGRAAWDWTR